MAIRFLTLAIAGLAAVTTAGCSLNLFGRGDRQPPPPAPLAAAPAGTITGTPLPPPDAVAAETPAGLAALDPSAGAAPVPAAAASGEIGRTDLLGGWTISAAGETCQLFMTLTTWAGGYRASTRGCATATFQGISAWNVEGSQVQLLNDAGTTVARLIPASRSQLNGQTSGGGPVTVTR
ncbi:MAG: AprI/Inh family metalloprotease inhibitor [Propylenella sp.]